MKNRKNIQVFTLVILCVSVSLHAHDTTHIHPLVTAEIARLIKNTDTTDSYLELYKEDPVQNPTNPADQFLYWGTDFDPVGIATTPLTIQDYLGGDRLAPYLVGDNPIAKNVITGVVFEDNPGLKVRHHFYHGASGEAIDVPFFSDELPSANRAMLFFNQAIEMMTGYTEEAKQEAYFLFGQALHHVEDMSSPSHIHNDIHLDRYTQFHNEKDDYEGWWLPQQKRTCGSNFETCDYFTSATAIYTVTNPWQNIWGTSGTSMVQEIYNATTYHANLDYTFSVFEEVANSYEYFTNAGVVPDPQGEMAEMFPCPLPAASPDICLHWNEDAPDAPAHWEINNVGTFYHQVYVLDENSWWPIEIETNSDTIGQEPAPYGDSHYIEQIASNNSNTTPMGDVLIPASLRSSLGGFWVGNMQTNNTISLLDKYARTFLAPAVTYGAGFTQYWYDVANTPPYLKAVTATQKTDAASAPAIVYEISWQDELTSTDPAMVDSRVFIRPLDKIKHIDNSEELIIELEFNEPIKQITLLRIGDFNPDGSCTSVANGCIDITPAAPVDGIAPPNVEFDADKGDSIWRIAVSKTQLNNLNGKLMLTVKAIDKNNHQDGQDGIIGSELDASPDTPARRDLSNVMNEDGTLIPLQNVYPWYAADGNDGKNDQFSYDYADGDQNHVFVFDTKGPATTITIDLTL